MMHDEPEPVRTPADEARALLKQLHLEEKIGLLYGSVTFGGVERLGIPVLTLLEESQGLLGASGSEEAFTRVPAMIGLAATFNRDRAKELGALFAREALEIGAHAVAAPAVGVLRDPRRGRAYSFLGEDPVLAAQLAVALVDGLQQLGIAACATHYVAGDCDFNRYTTSSGLSEPCLFNVHAKVSEMLCTQANVWMLRVGSHLVNREHVAENKKILDDILRGMWNWHGVVCTGSRSVYSAEKSVAAGVDLCMGECDAVYGDGAMLDLVRQGAVEESLIDQKVLRLLVLAQRTGVLSPEGRVPGELGSDKHFDLAIDVCTESIVLLKNDNNLLPISDRERQRLLVTGPGAERLIGFEHGGGAVPPAGGTLLGGLRAAYHQSSVMSESDTAIALHMLKSVDVVVYCAVAEPAPIGDDATNIELPAVQRNDIETLAAHGTKVIVALQCGSAVELDPWIEYCSAMLICWMGVPALGEAFARVIKGVVSPSGKLPCTFGRSIDDYPCAHLGEWPAKLVGAPPVAEMARAQEPVCAFESRYLEANLVGYRWFDRQQIAPTFPFGFGLSYARFSFSNLRVDPMGEMLAVSCSVHNEGDRTAAEVVQVYIEGPPGDDTMPLRELKAFQRIELEAGAVEEVWLAVPGRELAHYQSEGRLWRVAPGKHTVYVGPSSRHLDLAVEVDLPEMSFAAVIDAS